MGVSGGLQVIISSKQATSFPDNFKPAIPLSVVYNLNMAEARTITFKKKTISVWETDLNIETLFYQAISKTFVGTVKSRAVDLFSIQFWTLLIKGHST